MDEPIEGGGSFDATGAFLGGDDKLGGGDKVKASDTSQATHVSVLGEKGDKHLSEHSTAANNENSSKDDFLLNNNVCESAHTTSQKDDYVKPIEVVNDAPCELTGQKSESAANTRENDMKLSELDEKLDPCIESVVKKKQIIGNLAYKNTSKYSDTTIPSPPEQRDTKISMTTPTPPIGEKVCNVKTRLDLTPIDRLQEVAEDIEKLIMDDDQSCNESDDVVLTSNLHRRDTHNNKHPSGVGSGGSGGVGGGGDDMLSEAKASKDLTDHWFYRDPQGIVQGAFPAHDMHEWYKAGYFDDTLNVRRVCDPQFIELGELVKACNGSIPFISMPPINPPLLQSSNEISIGASAAAAAAVAAAATSAAAAAATVPKTTTPTKPLANHLQLHTGKMPPPTSANNPPYYDINNFLGISNDLYGMFLFFICSCRISTFISMCIYFCFCLQFYRIQFPSIQIRPSMHFKIH